VGVIVDEQTGKRAKATGPEPQRSVLASPLRPYQREAARAIVDSVLRRRGLSFSVEVARQGGKNELSARLELLLLILHIDKDIAAIKTAPTLRPQALISLDRLWQRVRDSGLKAWAAKENGNCVRLGRARQLFLSAEPSSNVVGHTAGLLLEIDEAQDVDVDKFDKELRPMAASTGATTVFYGTAWDDANLLERAKQTHLEAERRDGVRRHFEYDWQVVAAESPEYGRFVLGERERLGPDHPNFLSQYCLKSLPGAGKLLNPTQLSLLLGTHAKLDAPIAGETYVAGLDLAGVALEAGAGTRHDATVLTIGRVLPPDEGSPLRQGAIEVVRHYAWTGAAHTQLYGALVSLLRETWRIGRVAVDATGIGEPVASFLTAALGPSRVDAVKLSAETKSRLGFDLLSAVNGGRLRIYEGAASAERGECLRQLERCRAVYKPNRTLAYFVNEREGHDDYVISLALAVAAVPAAQPRRARGRSRDEDAHL
jgi:hypothetical protein